MVRDGDTLTLLEAGGTTAELDDAALAALVGEAVSTWAVRGRRVLVLVPDGTRTAPTARFHRALADALRRRGGGGRRPCSSPSAPTAPSTETSSNACSGSSSTRTGTGTRRDAGRGPRLARPVAARLRRALARAQVAEASSGLIDEHVPVRCNAAVAEHDLVVICGTGLPPRGRRFLGRQQVPLPGYLGCRDDRRIALARGAHHRLGDHRGAGGRPVHALIDAATAQTPIERRCLAYVVHPDRHDTGGPRLAYCSAGPPERAWAAAAAVAAELHVRRLDRAAHPGRSPSFRLATRICGRGRRASTRSSR